MSSVYANSNAIACKSGDGKVIAAFPDVCLSPPSPPAGPIPVPYPDSSFSRDTKGGSRSVTIGGKEVMLKDQSYYKSSPLGDEAATRSFGGSVVTHTISGKTYFAAYSMDVKFEGKNVCRHIDITTSNHASYPGSTPPFPDMEAMTLVALERLEKGVCPCCGKDVHTLNWSIVKDKKAKVAAKGKASPKRRRTWYKRNRGVKDMNMEEWYLQNINNHPTMSPETKVAKKTACQDLIARAKARPGCACPTPKPKLLPEPPCDVFFGPTPDPALKLASEDSWDSYRARYQDDHSIETRPAVVARLTVELGRAPSQEEVQDERQVNHLTPKSAGGCPTGDGNLQPNKPLCAECRKIEKGFSQFQ